MSMAEMYEALALVIGTLNPCTILTAMIADAEDNLEDSMEDFERENIEAYIETLKDAHSAARLMDAE